MGRVCAWIWDFSEYWDIPLGRLAPWVFGGMIGRWPHREK